MSTYAKFCTLVSHLTTGLLCEELYSYFGEVAMSGAVEVISNEWDIDFSDEYGE